MAKPKDSFTLLGHVATFRFVVQYSASLDFERSEEAYYRAMKIQEDLRYEIDGVVKKQLGNVFEVQLMSIRRGSIEIIVTIGTAITVYELISRYKNFIESLGLIRGQISGLLSRRIDLPENSITSSMEPSTQLIHVEKPNEFVHEENKCNWCNFINIFIFYILITHAAMLAFIGFVLFGRTSF